MGNRWIESWAIGDPMMLLLDASTIQQESSADLNLIPHGEHGGGEVDPTHQQTLQLVW